MDGNDAHWGYWQNHTDEARQHENLRAQAGAIIASAAGVVVAIVAEDGIGRDDAIPSIVVVLLGILGFAITNLRSRKAAEYNKVAGSARQVGSVRSCGGNSAPVRV